MRRDNRIAIFTMDPATGDLSLITTVPIEGEPIQIVVDRTGRFLLSVHLYQSTIGVHAIDEQGVIAPMPVEWRVTAYGCHGIEADPTNRYVFVPHVTRRRAAAVHRSERAFPGRGRQRRQRRPHGHLPNRHGERQDDAARRLRRRQRPDVDSDDAGR